MRHKFFLCTFIGLNVSNTLLKNTHTTGSQAQPDMSESYYTLFVLCTQATELRLTHLGHAFKVRLLWF